MPVLLLETDRPIFALVIDFTGQKLKAYSFSDLRWNEKQDPFSRLKGCCPPGRAVIQAGGAVSPCGVLVVSVSRG